MVAIVKDMTRSEGGDDTAVRPLERRVIMGIDSATIQMGWGVIEYLPDSRTARYLDCGVVKMPDKMSVPQRLGGIATELRGLVAAYQPSDGVVENAFVSEKVLMLNQRTAIALGEGRGAVLCTLAQCEVQNITSYTPAQVKAVVTGSGASTKEQVSFWVKNSLIDGNLIGLVPLDATDALALALTHSILYGKQGVIVTAVAQQKRRVARRR